MSIVREFLEGFGFSPKAKGRKRYGKKCGHGKGPRCGCGYWKKHKQWKGHGSGHGRGYDSGRGRKRGGNTVIIIKT